MSRKIKTSILRPNNLKILGKLSQCSISHNQQSKSNNQNTNSFRYTLKSLSQQRNMIKILKKIDSPNQGSPSPNLNSANLNQELTQKISNLQQQLNQRKNSRSSRNQKRDSLYKLTKKGIPYSKINLTQFCLLSNKKNESKSLQNRNSTKVLNSSTSRMNNTVKQQKKQLNISRAILQKVRITLKKLNIVPLKSSISSMKTSCQSKQQIHHPSKIQINIVSNSKKKGIQVFQKNK